MNFINEVFFYQDKCLKRWKFQTERVDWCSYNKSTRLYRCRMMFGYTICDTSQYAFLSYAQWIIELTFVIMKVISIQHVIA